MRRGLLGRLVGFSAVSAGAVVVTQAVLIVAYSVFDWPAVAANVAAVCVAAAPAYYANRRWVWARTDRHSMSREVLPFWSYNLMGLGLSSLTVVLAERWWHSALAVSVANLAGFGVLWAGKFILLDRVLFARSEPQSSPRPAADSSKMP